MRRFAVSVLLLLVRGSVSAQVVASAPHVLSGAVYDSIGRRFLQGAVVEVVGVDGAKLSFTAITDSIGRFRLVGLPSGRFAVGFQHDALNALGLESPIRGLDMVSDSVTLDLAIPSGPVVRSMACDTSDGHDGLLAGYVLDARSGAPLVGAEVLLQWVELELRNKTLQSAPHRVIASVGEGGAYKACGIPANGALTLSVSSKNMRKIEAELTLPAGGVERRDFHLVDANAIRGAAAISVRVVDDSNGAVMGGRAGIPELGLEAPIENGSVRFSDIPAGTWLVTVRSLGRQPRLLLVDATPQGATETIEMPRGAPMLETVRVVGIKAQRDSSVISSIQQRLLVARGTLIRSDNMSVLNGSYASDAIRAAAGFMMRGPTSVSAGVTATGKACASVPRPTNPPPGFKTVIVYLDGMKMPAGLESINQMVPVKDILAVEAYPDVTSAPFLWRTNDACAVVAFWTKH